SEGREAPMKVSCPGAKTYTTNFRDTTLVCPMFFLYNILSIIVLPFYLSLSALRGRLNRDELRERLGIVGKKAEGRRLVWIHGASVGEMSACVPLVREIRKRFPGIGVVVSSMTRAGKTAAAEKIPGAGEVFLAPLDASLCTETALRRISPDAVIVLETELWPNLLRSASKAHVKCAIANGRLSERSAGRYRFLRPVLKPILAGMDAVIVQTDDDMERFLRLGAVRERTKVLGNMKDDMNTPGEIPPDEKALLRESLGLGSKRRVVVAGSTRPGEEEEIVAAFEKVRGEFPETLLVLAPRHMKRVKEVERILSNSGLSFRKRTVPDSRDASQVNVVLLDTVGELRKFFSAADISFVGGTIKPYGGHNVIEPAALGIPVSFGPNFEKCKDAALALIESGGGKVGRDGIELGDIWLGWMRDKSKRTTAGKHAVRTVLGRMGASERTVSFLAERGVLR
ncbi:MAG: 3-deoxy-D-manno-octulosonic acid transferase, partial [Candidatus Eisenbacteria bacterium]|nr:3-deoxy-D-manno-octulosonic acid transferase [Candidatus Eisenbacteria bacterium]